MHLWKPNESINDGRFVIQKVLGIGGFGITYCALEQPEGRLIAIKTLNLNQQIKNDFPKLQVKFINKALNLRTFSHPYIVQVHEVIQEKELWGIVMEFIDGVDLKTYVDEHGQLSEDEALLYIDQIGQALHYIHLKKYLHRDIKPHNIILRRGKKETVLVDFGLARNIEIESMTNAGTDGYAPIEQYSRKGNFGAYTDVYALAATLYYLLTADGLRAANEIITPAFLRKYTNTPLPPPQQYNHKISDRINDAIMKGMELEADKRPQSILEFRKLLKIVKTSPQLSKSPNHLQTASEICQLESIVSLSNLRTKQNENELESTVSVNYNKLQNLLAAGRWSEADAETTKAILSLVTKNNVYCLSQEDFNKLPNKDLEIIDQLWIKYSDNHFGFSVQENIYQTLFDKRYNDWKIWEAFGNAVGWRKNWDWLFNKSITFNLLAPKGHLPSFVLWCAWGGVGGICWVAESRDWSWCENFFSYFETSYINNRKFKNQTVKILEPDDELISSLRIDYRRLRDLLRIANWNEAEKETMRVMLAVANREQEDWFDIDDIAKFPCEDFRIIDQLWIKYSNDFFGFSVQKRIYESLGGTSVYYSHTWKAFCEAVGWNRKKIHLNTEEGYYPNFTLLFNQDRFQFSVPGRRQMELGIFGVWFLSRIDSCKLPT